MGKASARKHHPDRPAAAAAGAAPPAAPWWSIPRPLAVVLLAAAAYRAVYVFLYLKTSVFAEAMLLDSRVYDAWARTIASGRLMGTEAFYFPPLYPYLLGTVYGVFGHSYAIVYVLQAALGLLNILLVHRVAAAVSGPRAGVIAACAAALYAPLPFFETKLLGTTLGLTLNLAALLLLVRAEEADARGGRPGRPWLLAGLAIGGAALCVPGTILLGGLYVIRLVRRRGRAAALLCAGTCAALLPVLAHNLAVARDPLLLSGQGGVTFYQGNNPASRGLYNFAPGFSGSPDRQAEEEKTIAEREAGRPLRRSQISAHFLGKGLAYIASSPSRWLVLEMRKLGHLVGNYEASTEYSLYLERDSIPWLRLAALPFAVLVAAGLAGWTTAPRGSPRPITGPGAGSGAAARRAAAGALLVFTVYAAAIPLLFYVSSRYRLPLAAALLIHAAGFADRLPAALRGAGGARVAHGRAALAAAILALVSFFPLGQPNVTGEANVHYNIGNLLLERGRHAEALASYDRALAGWPGNAYAWINRGNALDKLRREDDALASYRRAEEANPRFWTAYKAQGVILHRRRQYAEEEEVYRRGLPYGGAEARYLLGVILQRLSRGDEARAMFQEAVRLNPREARAHTRLGEIAALHGDAAAARRHFEQALAANPRDEAARGGLARLASPAPPEPASAPPESPSTPPEPAAASAPQRD